MLLRIGLSNAAAAAVLALVALAAGLLVRKPALTHGLWVLVLLKLISPPLWTIPLHLPLAATRPPSVAPTSSRYAPPAIAVDPATANADTDIDAELGRIQTDAAPAKSASGEIPWSDLRPAEPLPAPATQPPVRAWISPAILTLWLAGTLMCALVSAGRLVCFRRMVLHCAIPAPQPIQRQARALSRRLGMHDCPEVWLVPGAMSPMLWAAGRAAWVLVPQRLLERLDERQRATLLAHELAHLRRRDHWVRYLELLTTCLYWWNPVCWWARRELREAGEQCCDAWVLWAMPGSFRHYATALLEAIEFLSQPRPPVPMLASGLGQFGQLKRRFAMLKQGTVSKALTWRGLCGLCGAAALLLPLVPTLAQPADRPANADRATPRETSANAAAAASAQDNQADEAEAQANRAEAEAEQKAADLERAQAAIEQAKEQRDDADAERQQSEFGRAQEVANRAQAIAEQAVAAAKEQAAKAMAEAQQAIEHAAKEDDAQGEDEGDRSKHKDELRAAIKRAQAEAARAMEQAKRQMADAMAEAKRAMEGARRQAEQAQRDVFRERGAKDSDLRRQLDEARQQIRALHDQLAQAKQQLRQFERGRGSARSDEPSSSSENRTARGRSAPEREERLQKLEKQLQSLLGEVRALQHEDSGTSSERAR